MTDLSRFDLSPRTLPLNGVDSQDFSQYVLDDVLNDDQQDQEISYQFSPPCSLSSMNDQDQEYDQVVSAAPIIHTKRKADVVSNEAKCDESFQSRESKDVDIEIISHKRPCNGISKKSVQFSQAPHVDSSSSLSSTVSKSKKNLDFLLPPSKELLNSLLSVKISMQLAIKQMQRDLAIVCGVIDSLGTSKR